MLCVAVSGRGFPGNFGALTLEGGEGEGDAYAAAAAGYGVPGFYPMPVPMSMPFVVPYGFPPYGYIDRAAFLRPILQQVYVCHPVCVCA